MGALKLTYRPEKNTLNLRIAYKSDSVNQREPSTKDSSNLRLHYYVFGMQMPGVGYRNPDGYLFGFNGQEQTPELAPSHTTAMFWEYDARLGKRWNLDPKPQISISDYACFANNPILFSDPLGDKVRYKKLRDRLNSWGSWLTSKNYRKKWKRWNNLKEDVWIEKQKGAKNNLRNASMSKETHLSPTGGGSCGLFTDYNVYYDNKVNLDFSIEFSLKTIF